MIRFACRCSHAFQLPDEQAGLTVQCPNCGLLVDVPNVGDLTSIEADGTYRLDSPDSHKPNENLDILSLVYYPARRLPDGSEIDLRGPVAPIPVSDTPPDAPPPHRLKYDPETGELLQPLEVEKSETPTEHPHQIPMAQRVIDYNVTRQSLEGIPHGIGVYAALFLPVNLMVMLITAGVHVIFTLIAFIAGYLIFFLPFALGIAAMIAGTFTIAVQEIGPGDKDELPRPLRNVAIYDDYIAPALQAFFAIIICYWPGLLILYLNFQAAARGTDLPFPAAAPWLLGSLLLGTFFMPAVLLTLCTSGTVLNLRPDRVVKLMGVIGWRYALLCAEWLLGSTIYLFAAISLLVSWRVGIAPLLQRPYVVFPALMLGIYLCFAFCWHLGLQYRLHWNAFPWIAQRHERQQTTVTIRRPTLHPKVAAADKNAAQRARSRSEIR